MKVELVLRAAGVEVVRQTGIDLPAPANGRPDPTRDLGFSGVLRQVIRHADTEDQRFLDVQAGAYFAGMLSALIDSLYGPRSSQQPQDH